MDNCHSIEESWDFTHVKVSKLKHLWTVDKFSFVTESEKLLRSSVLSPKPDNSTKWCICLYPKGVSSDDHGTYLSLYIKLVSSERPKVRAKFKFSLLNGKGEESKSNECERVYTFVVGKDWGFRKFVRRDSLYKSKLIVNDTLTISCQLQVADQYVTNDALPRTIMSKTPYFTNSQDNRILSKKSAMKIKCYVSTASCEEIRLFKVDPSMDNVYEDLVRTLMGSYQRQSDTSSLTLTWTDEEGDEIVVSSNGELQAALEETNTSTLKMRVTVKGVGDPEDDFQWDLFPEKLTKPHALPDSPASLDRDATPNDDAISSGDDVILSGDDIVLSLDTSLLGDLPEQPDSYPEQPDSYPEQPDSYSESSDSDQCCWNETSDFHLQENVMVTRKENFGTSWPALEELPQSAALSTSSNSSLMSEFLKREILRMRTKKSKKNENEIMIAPDLEQAEFGATKDEISVSDNDDSTLKEVAVKKKVSNEDHSTDLILSNGKGDSLEKELDMKKSVSKESDCSSWTDDSDKHINKADVQGGVDMSPSENDDFVLCSEDPVTVIAAGDEQAPAACESGKPLTSPTVTTPSSSTSTESCPTVTDNRTTEQSTTGRTDFEPNKQPNNEPSTSCNIPASALKLPDAIHAALDCMLAMGYTNEGEWLANLLLHNRGDINSVIDILSSNATKQAAIRLFHGMGTRK